MSNSTEAGIVMLLAFGWFIFISTLIMLVRLNGHGSWTDDVTSDGFNQILVFETVILVITFCFLWCRGWSWSDLNLGFSINHIRDAIILLVVTMIILSTVFAALKAAGIYAVGDGAGTFVKGDVNWYFLVPSILINSLYEEFFLLCYLFKRLDRSTPVMIIGISTLIRVSYHTYQGPLGWISLLVMGIIMALSQIQEFNRADSDAHILESSHFCAVNILNSRIGRSGCECSVTWLYLSKVKYHRKFLLNEFRCCNCSQNS